MSIVMLGIDLAKNIFQLHGIDSDGKITLRKRLSRSELPKFIAALPPCLTLAGIKDLIGGLNVLQRILLYANYNWIK